MGEQSNTSYLLDTGGRRMYGAYVETAGTMSSCTLIRSAQQVTVCKNGDEFLAFVSDYMEKQMQGK